MRLPDDKLSELPPRVVRVRVDDSEYTFNRSPTGTKCFSITKNGRTLATTVPEGASLSAALLGLMSQVDDMTFFAEPAIEAAFRAGYLVGMWEAKYGKTRHD